MKQTAVDFLANALDINTKSLIFEQAKELEKQQIIGAIAESNKSNNRNVSLNPEKYYYETFKKL